MNNAKLARIKKVKRGKGSGKVLTPDQLKSGLDGLLYELAKGIKEFIIASAQEGGKHKFRNDGKEGFVQSTKVEFNTDGVKIDLPEQAQYINNGRKAGAKKVPIAALVKWLKRYRVVSRDKTTGKYQKASQGSINSAAYAIQTAIFKNGIKARPFIEKSMKYAEETVAQIIQEVMIPEILTLIEFHFKDKK